MKKNYIKKFNETLNNDLTNMELEIISKNKELWYNNFKNYPRAYYMGHLPFDERKIDVKDVNSLINDIVENVWEEAKKFYTK